MLILSLCVSAVAIVLATHHARSSGNLAEATAHFFGISLLCSGFPVLLLSSVLMAGFVFLPLGLVASYLKAGWRRFLFWELVATTLGYAVVGYEVFHSIVSAPRVVHATHTEFLSRDLSYEARNLPSGSLSSARPPNSATAANALALTEMERAISERRRRENDRAAELKGFHFQTVVAFINSPGFGSSRMIALPPRKEIWLPEIRAVPLPDSGADLDHPPTSTARNSSNEVALTQSFPALRKEEQSSLASMHLNGVVDFVNPRGFGIKQGPDIVQDFQEHHFQRIPEPAMAGEHGRSAWQLRSLQLISLLRFAHPMAYVSSNLPRMDELRKASTRPLNDFEKVALAELEQGADLQFAAEQNRVNMLGAIRATTECLDCHNVKRGELLGAFSYVLTRSP